MEQAKRLASQDPDADPLSSGDDLVAPFAIEKGHVKGRIARFGPGTVDEVLTRHDYHPVAAHLLGELLTLAALVGSSLKFDGKLIVQVQSQNPDSAAISFMVAEYRTNGTIRGYCKADGDSINKLDGISSSLTLTDLFGSDGIFTMTIDQGEDMDRYQGTVALQGHTLAEAASAYFSQSEQVPTQVRIACDLFATGGERDEWRAGGIMVQQIANDATRETSTEAWEQASILAATVTDDELLDPYLSAGVLLYRLFHEMGVRLFKGLPVEHVCTCSRDRIVEVLRQFGPDATDDMLEPDGLIRVRCEYCSKSYDIKPTEL